MELFSVEREFGGMLLQLPDEQIWLSADDKERVERGEALPAEHPLTRRLKDDPRQLVLLQADDVARVEDQEQFLFALARAYPAAPIRMGKGLLGAEKKLADLGGHIATPENTMAVIADRSFGVSDAKVIQNLRETLVGAMRIEVVKPGGEENLPVADTVIVISGHQDAALERFAGAVPVKDAFVVLAACNGTHSRRAAQIMIERGAKAVFRYEKEIRAAQVSDMVGNFAQPPAGTGVRFEERLWRALEHAHLNGFFQTSALLARKGQAYG